jgi:transcriptional regulator with XRE-family HTH domain
VVKISDLALGGALWGSDRKCWPRHWHSDLTRIGEGLGWLHVADCLGTDAQDFGQSTALLTHFADLRGAEEDACDSNCPDFGGPHHHHYLVNIGCGFLGVLEQFAQPDDGSGARTYDFPVGTKGSNGPTLWRVGKTGRLISCFVPAELGDPLICKSFTSSQRQLLRALVRETTRARRQRRKEPAGAELLAGNMIPDVRGRALLQCDYLDANAEYVGFNGNKKRRGLGYLLTTPGGLLAKAGYSLGDVRAYLADLDALAQRLGLVTVGIHKSTAELFDLDGMQALSLTQPGERVLEKLHVRIYTAADYVDRWSSVFNGPDRSVAPVNNSLSPTVSLAREMARKKINQLALARGIGADTSLLSKIFRGKKAISAALLKRAIAWLEIQPAPRLAPIKFLSQASDADHPDFLSVALAYRQRGWSIVPQTTGAKSPCVKWKPFQSSLPTETQLRTWSRTWPSAGLAVVLGPVSDLFVIDVDGEDAHQALLQRLGREPRPPKVISGSGKPFRYHLFFRHPDIATKAKVTPWHASLEFRGDRGIVIIPPSLHKSGNRYAWAPGQSLDELSLPKVPKLVLSALKESLIRVSVAAPISMPTSIGRSDIAASQATLQFLSGKFANGPNWNGRLFAAACDLKGRKMPLGQAEPLLLAGAQPSDSSENDTARRTIQSAYSQGREPSRH